MEDWPRSGVGSGGRGREVGNEIDRSTAADRELSPAQAHARAGDPRAAPRRPNRARRATLSPGLESNAGLSAAALRVLATVLTWWARRAAAAGLGAHEQRVTEALAASPPLPEEVLATIGARTD